MVINLENLEEVVKHLEAGKWVNIRGLGYLVPRRMKARKYYIPATGETIDMPDRLKISFVKKHGN
jgi:nucleoid DNA-binding protein